MLGSDRFPCLARFMALSVLSLCAFLGLMSRILAGPGLLTLKTQDAKREFRYDLEYRDPRLSDTNLTRILDVLCGVTGMVGDLKVPKPRLSVRDRQSRFMYSKGVLSIGHEYRYKGLWAPFEKARIAIAHEWGHAIFDANMRERSVAWRNMASQVGDGGFMPALGVQERALWLVGRAYSEFYADLVASLYFDDLDAMSTSLEHIEVKTGQMISHDPKKLRGFSLRLDNKGWRPGGRSKSKIYLVLAPTRSHIGRTYLVRLSKGQKASALQAVLKAMATEFDSLSSGKDRKELEPERLNSRLMRALDRQFKTAFADQSVHQP